MKTTIVATLVAGLVASSAWAGWDEASTAYQQGRYALAYKECKDAASQGDRNCQNFIGFLYANGRGVPQNDQQAVAWYRKAAEQGDASAQFNLGGMYDNGKGVPQDYKEAVAWYRKAAEQGFAEAQNNLGGMYANGRGVPQDLVVAYTLFNLSAAQGADMAVKNRDRLLPQLNPRQVQEGQRLAAEWKPGRPLPTKSTTGK